MLIRKFNMKMKPSNRNNSLFLGNSESALVPLFSSSFLAVVFNTMWLIGLLLLMFWPQKSFPLYFQEQDTPLNFLIVFLAVLLVISFLSLRSGKGEFIIQDFAERMTRTESTTQEEVNGFIMFGLVRAISQTLFLCLPYLPILIISAAITEISLPMLGGSITILYTSALACRLFGFLIYLLLGKWNQLGTLICWGFYLLLIVGTGFFAPFANPVLLIYHYFRGFEGFLIYEGQTQTYFLMSITSVIAILIFLCWFITRRSLSRETS